MSCECGDLGDILPCSEMQSEMFFDDHNAPRQRVRWVFEVQPYIDMKRLKGA